MKRILFALVFAVLLSGCTTVRPVVSQPKPKLTLSNVAETRTTWGVTAAVTLPPGEYRAMFEDASGVYYMPEGRILIAGQPFDRATVLVEEGRAVALWVEGAKVIDRFNPPVVLK